MRGKAGIALAILALAGLGAFAATGFGAGSSRVPKVSRPAALDAHVSFGTSAAKAGARLGGGSGKVLYGSAKVSVPPGDSTITLGACPKKSHIINGTAGALHGNQASNFTIRGYGLISQKKWFVDINNASTTVPFMAVGFIVCEK